MASSLDGIFSSLLLPITVPTRPQERNTQYLETKEMREKGGKINHDNEGTDLQKCMC